MIAFILGEKSKQSQSYNEKGERIPTTFINTTPCYLIDVKWPAKHGFFSVKLGYGQTKNIKKPMLGELTKAGIKTPLHFIRELRLDTVGDKVQFLDENNKRGIIIGELKLWVGEQIKPTLFFKKGEMVNVSGMSKGKGFQGVVKRHGFRGGPRTHGQSDRERAPGSIGMTTTPGRVFKGKRMAGRMGGERKTIKNLELIEVREEGLLIKGLVPGSIKSRLEIRKFI